MKYFSRKLGFILLTAVVVSSQLSAPVYAENKNSPTNKELPEGLMGKNQGAPPVTIKKGKFMFSVELHDRDEIDSLLTRAETLSKSMRIEGNKSVIALILHGPEIEYFTKEHFAKNREMVERAARLDKSNVIKVKVCKTKMKELGVKEKDLPSFMEIIPYAPEEEKRLQGQGYVYF